MKFGLLRIGHFTSSVVLYRLLSFSLQRDLPGIAHALRLTTSDDAPVRLDSAFAVALLVQREHLADQQADQQDEWSHLGRLSDLHFHKGGTKIATGSDFVRKIFPALSFARERLQDGEQRRSSFIRFACGKCGPAIKWKAD